MLPVPLAARSKPQVYGRAPAESVSSNPTGAWTFVCCECWVLSGRGLCYELITRPEESYRLWRVVVCDLETSKEEAKSPLNGCEYKPAMGCDAERERERKNSNMFWQLISLRLLKFKPHSADHSSRGVLPFMFAPLLLLYRNKEQRRVTSTAQKIPC